MLLADILFLAIVAYLLYRFVFNFLLPIMRATQQVRQQFRNMQGTGGVRPGDFGGADEFVGSAGKTAGFGGGGSAGGSGSAGQARAAATGSAGAGGGKGQQKPPAEDYIDFEEIK